jgi:hypothetical protein
MPVAPQAACQREFRVNLAIHERVGGGPGRICLVRARGDRDLRAALIAVEGRFVVGVVGEEAGRVAAAGLAALALGDEGGAAVVFGL